MGNRKKKKKSKVPERVHFTGKYYGIAKNIFHGKFSARVSSMAELILPVYNSERHLLLPRKCKNLIGPGDEVIKHHVVP